MNRFSPGPWTKDGWTLVDANNEPVLITGNLGIGIASGHERPERIANDQLILAAPLLVEALREMITLYSERETVGIKPRPKEEIISDAINVLFRATDPQFAL